MSKVFADAIESPNEDGTVTIGTSTNTVTATGNIVQANTIKDSGGNTLWTSDGAGNLSSFDSELGSNLKLLSTHSIENGSNIQITSGIDSTYDVYLFKFYDINPQSDSTGSDSNGTTFHFQVSSNGGTSYGMTITSTNFVATVSEGGSNGRIEYVTAGDLAQSTSYQPLGLYIGSSPEECLAGQLYLFAPSSTTFVKHFYGNFSNYTSSAYVRNPYVGGYVNSTSAVNAIDFKMATGEFNGTIKMYGLL